MLKRLNFFLKPNFKFFSLSAVSGVVVGVSVNRKRTVTMEESYVTINKVPTHIFTWGKSLQEKNEGKPKEMIIVITGNPGTKLNLLVSVDIARMYHCIVF
jgi:hypothetical protein